MAKVQWFKNKTTQVSFKVSEGSEVFKMMAKDSNFEKIPAPKKQTKQAPKQEEKEDK